MNTKPDALKQKIASEQDVVIVLPKDIVKMPLESLYDLEKYYCGMMEALAGTQVWKILDALKLIQITIQKLVSKQPNSADYEINKLQQEIYKDDPRH